MHQVTINNDLIGLTTLDYGAIVQKILIKDKNGREHNCAIGFESPEDYLKDHRFLGACVGRFAGRISKGQFSIAETTYQIFEEDGVHLHGGQQGFGRRFWKLIDHSEAPDPCVTYQYISPHLEEGYPGQVIVNVTYQLLGNSLKILHKATTDRPTIVNLTNHSYFKLDEETTLDDLVLQIQSEKRLVTDEKLLPTGHIELVENTKFDFRQPKRIENLRLDTPYVVDPAKKPLAIVRSLRSGIQLSVSSNQPALVVYTPEDLAAICFETQNYPDAPNQPSFPSSLLLPGETYINESFFTFDLVP
ncbi:aldose epimerase family protein [uncultured Muriicola sp.]|uniref:aldose epimerase family protein n=1 Tax=uncultured Muriicola sp. TaxID=1583102 RepID=UPI002636E536|nr:aldose epimerase family protein [uncultured Muriicola sp.]